MYNNSSNENNETISNTEQQKIEECKKIFNAIFDSDNLIEYDQIFSYVDNNNLKEKYYLINKEWCIKFKKYCQDNNTFIEYSNPGKIDNSNLIIEDDSTLKTKNETRIFFNNNYDFDYSCMFIKKEFWVKLKNIFGGGPEYEIIYHHNNNTNLIKEGGHINLLFIPNKDNIIKNKSKNFINIKHIYFNLKRKVQDLRKYINSLLNSHKKKFSINNKENLDDNKHYRLWLYSSFVYIPNQLANFLSNLIINNINNEGNSRSSLINWSNLKNNNHQFKMVLLSHFDNNEVKDIFPNEYTNNFEWEEYKKLRRKDKYSLPEFTIIIEQEPYQFMTDKKIYSIGICNKCKYNEIVYCGACDCKKLWFCRNDCEQKYKNNLISLHYSKCKIYLMKLYNNENKEFLENKNKEENNNLKFPLIGLINLGNTCYMNSALQCMRSIKELSLYFLYYYDESQLNINNIIGTGGFLTKAYINFLYNLENCKDEYFKPEYFKNTIGLIDDRYSDFLQQDTHEFMTFLIDSLHEDLNKVRNKPIIQRKDSDINNYNSDEMNDKKSLIEWNNFLKANQSIMVDLFYGQYKTTISCPCCHHKSINFSIYLSLQLPIPKYMECFMIKVIITEEGPNSFPLVKINITLNKINNKIFNIKKIIGKIFEISPYEIEIIKYRSKEIIKVYEDDEEINDTYNIFYAIKVNFIDKSIFYENKIVYSNLKEKIINKKNDIINIFKNNNDNDKKENNDTKNNSHKKHSLEKFIIKHYYLSDKDISTDIFNNDYLIYLPTKKTCYEIYYKIYEIYFEIIINNYLQESPDDIPKFNNDLYKKNLFNKLFKNFINKENDFKNDIFEDDSENKLLPFILKIGNITNKKNEYIPFTDKYIFKDYINSILINNNQNNVDNNNNNEKNENLDSLNDIEINNYGEKNGDMFDKELPKIENNLQKNNDISNINENKHKYENKNNKYDPSNQNLFKINKEKNNSKSLNNANEKTKSQNENKETSIKINIEKDKGEDSKNINTIIIIFNTKFIKKKESNNNYYLTDNKSEDIDLMPFFQEIYETNFKKILIDKCFEEFSKEETFDKDNLWKCSKCSQNIPATNKMEIYQIPKILIIQLKRFKNNQKIESFIDFPLKDLDINKFIPSSSTFKKNYNIPKKYDLFAVANHYGRLEYGHYDAFCLNYINNNWYNFNDRFVKKIEKENEEKDIVTQYAYVLFYREQNNDLYDWDKIYKKSFEVINDNNMKIYGQDFIYKNGNHIKNKYSDNVLYGINWEEIENGRGVGLNNEKKMEIDDIEDHSLDDLSLSNFVYDPFKNNYLKMKRRLNRK